MNSPKPEKWVFTGFNSEQWHNRPRIFSVFFVTAFIAFIISLFFQLLIPGFRNPAAVLLFVSTFATTCTWVLVSAQLSVEGALLSRFTARVNGTILELTGSRSDVLTPRQVKALIENGHSVPLFVNGVPGLDLRFTSGQPWDKGSADVPEPMGTISTAGRLRAALQPGEGQRLIETAGSLCVLLGNAPRRMIREVRAREMFANTEEPVTATDLVITVVAPDYGAANFDRLVAALNDAGPRTS